MRTQISRFSHDPSKRFSGVYQQQGRMITDADWNELVEVIKARLDRSLADVIGSGIPHLHRLRIAPTGGGLVVEPGVVYIDGIRGELLGTTPISLTAQADFPRAIAPAADCRLYVDLWERAVTSLEDADLLDPGLHGADTCSRALPLVQIKWCPAATSPENPAVNPRVGTAVVAFELWSNTAAGDSADPCLTNTLGDARVGNYLFRVEVHEAKRSVSAGTETLELTLKWSSENAAEQESLVWRDQAGAEHRNFENLSPDFLAGHFVYELYNDACEKHLGVHLAAGFTASRGLLGQAADLTGTLPSIEGAEVRYVRRWDGRLSIRLTRTGAAAPWVLATGSVSGVDRNQTLRYNTPGYGNVETIAKPGGNSQLAVSLEGLILKLDLDSHTFVPGDYWLAVVRERAAYYAGTSIDERIRVHNGGKPVGIVHHYLEIARLNGGVLQPYTSGGVEEQRLDFPPLTALTAAHVGYDPAPQAARWADINDPAAGIPRPPITVQEAIDDLVANLESSDVTYPLPPCETTTYGVNTLNRLLRADIANQVVGSDGRTRTKLQDLWNALLCKLDARHLPYDPTVSAARWADVSEQVWVRQFGGVGHDNNRGLAVDPGGNIVIAGSFEGTAAFGDHVLTSLGARDIYLAKLTPKGDILWAKRAGAAVGDQGEALAVDASGNIVLVGLFGGTLDLGGSSLPLTSGGSDDVFVAKFAPDGRCLWSRRLGGPFADIGYALAIDTAGSIVIAGYFQGTLTLNGVPAVTAAGSADIFVAKLTPDGAPSWLRRYGGGGFDVAYGVSTDRQNNIVLTGTFSATSSFEGTNVTSAGSTDVFVLKLTPAGVRTWVQRFGAVQADYARSIKIDGNDDILLTGYFQDTINFGGAPLTSSGSYDVFVAKLAGSDGAHRWSRRFGSGGAEYGHALALDSHGNVIVAGYFSGEIDFGGGVLRSEGGYDAFVAVLDANGSHRRSVRMAARGTSFGRNVAAAPDGGIIVAGIFDGSVDFGGEPLTSAGGTDIFVSKLLFDRGGPTTVQAAIDELLNELDSGDIGFQIPGCGTDHDSLRRRLPSLADLDTGTSTRVSSVLTALLCELDAQTIPFSARNPNAPAVSIGELMVKKTGDNMTGALAISTGNVAQTVLDANGVIAAKGLRLQIGTPVNRAVLTYDQPTGLAQWLQTSLTAWNLANGNLSTDPASVTGTITLGSATTKTLIPSGGSLGIGVSPESPFHIRSTIAVNDVAEIRDGVQSFGSWASGMYGRAVNWNTDALFLGLRNEGSDRKDAIIGWADNSNDRLRFVFAPVNQTPIDMLRMSQGEGIVVPHAATGDTNSKSIEIGSPDSVLGSNGANGRIGFPGKDVAHGQVRWVPITRTFEFVDSSTFSPSGNYGTNPTMANLRAKQITATGGIFFNRQLAQTSISSNVTIGFTGGFVGLAPNVTIQIPAATRIRIRLTIASLNVGATFGTNTVAFRAVVGSTTTSLGSQSTGTTLGATFEGELDVGAGGLTVALQWMLGNALGSATITGTRTLTVDIA